MTAKRRVLEAFPRARLVEGGYRKFRIELWPDGAFICQAYKRSRAWELADMIVAEGLAEAAARGLEA
jgi:hypothetical protein